MKNFPPLLRLPILLYIVTPAFATDGLLKRCGIPSMYVFGDSLYDSGNAVVAAPNSYAHRFPNGMTIGEATGRFCDGYLIVDRIAAGLPPTNPYQNKSLDHSTGANFAVGGVGLVSKETRREFHMKQKWSQSSLDVQLGWLDEFLSGDSSARENIGSSLFVLGGGGNDYGNFHVNDPFYSQKHHAWEKKLIMPYILEALNNGIKKIISAGAKRIVVCGIYQPGCLPSKNDTALPVDDGPCSKPWNAFGQLHNDLVQQQVQKLENEFPDVRIVYGDIWGAVNWLFENYHSLGFKHSHYSKCCGRGNRPDCGAPGTPYCTDPNDYMFWDSFHFTDHANRVISEKMIPQIASGLQCESRSSSADNTNAPSQYHFSSIAFLLLCLCLFF